MYAVVIDLGVQHTDSVIHLNVCVYMCIYIFFFRIFSISYYKILNVVPCAIQ